MEINNTPNFSPKLSWDFEASDTFKLLQWKKFCSVPERLQKDLNSTDDTDCEPVQNLLMHLAVTGKIIDRNREGNFIQTHRVTNGASLK